LMKDLFKYGMPFDLNSDNSINLTLEGGHSRKRIFHHKDFTGKKLQEILLKHLSSEVDFYENEFVFDVIQDKYNSFHTFSLDAKNKTTDFISNYLILATGGIGMLYEKTTNQQLSTGDGIHLAHKVGAKIRDLSYIQFHPTGLYTSTDPTALITEALRGEGAILKNSFGDTFMHKYDTRNELAPRDIVSRGIFSEMQNTNSPCVFLDATKLDNKIWKDHFPSIYRTCMINKIDPSIEMIPVVPTQHYSCGGVITDEFGETDIKNLFAIGEVASTGLHGSNRLASNSLLEGLAFGKFSAIKIFETFSSVWNYEVIKKFDFKDYKLLNRNFLRKLISSHAGVIKSNHEMIKTKNTLIETIFTANNLRNLNKLEIENNIMFNVGVLLLNDAINKNENSGVFFKL
jgi:L-aspartate oxidase